MPTLEELLADTGLSEKPVHTKVASSAAPTTKEIDETLESLGLSGSDAVKTASEAIPADNGGEMKNGLQGIYESVFGEEKPAASEAASTANTDATKVASENTPTEEAPGSAEEVLGEVTASLFSEAVGTFFEKAAGDLEAEAGAGHKPFNQAPSSLGKSMGMGGNPHMAVNNSVGDHEKVHAMTGGTSPYSLKEKALAKAILRRSVAAPVGNITE